MKNILNYYYSLYPNEVRYNNEKYFFEYMDSKYVFEVFKRPLSDIDSIYKINRQMIQRDILVHEIILNNDKKILTFVNNTPYILMEIFVNEKIRITLPEICHINNDSINIESDNILSRNDWVNLWEIKIDYIESQINEVGKKYPNLSNYANYYIGLAENAIFYVRNANKIEDLDFKSVCHKRINYYDEFYTLYNPTEYIYDYRFRDVCEYIKSAFFNGEDTYTILNEYFMNNILSYKEALLFYGRLLYPSYFFDMYDDIINNNLEEKLIEKIILRTNEYEIFLYNVYLLLLKLYNRYIPSVDWIIKRSFNQTSS